MLFGLLSALGWGTADLVAALAGRRIGSTRTVAIAQVVSLVVLAGLGLAFGQGSDPTGAAVVWLLANGVLAATAYITFFRALELGPVALVSPIVAAYAAIAILLAVLVNGERLSDTLVWGSALTLIGVVAASADPRQLRRTRLGGGIPWAFASMLLFGVATYILGDWSQEIGWFPATLLSRIGNVIVVLVFAWWMRRRPVPGPLDAKGWALAVAVGLADIVGVVAYAVGVETAQISVVAAASAAFILVPVLGGLTLFGERPAASQLVGVAAVLAGLMLLGVGLG